MEVVGDARFCADDTDGLLFHIESTEDELGTNTSGIAMLCIFDVRYPSND